MILRMLLIMLAFGTSPMFAGGERGNRLSNELGGLPGTVGADGLPGVAGLSAAFEFADFFAVNPPNAQVVAVGAAVAFPNTASLNGNIISTLGGTVFVLTTPGTYQVEFQVPVTETAQLQLLLGAGSAPPNADNIVGRSGLSTQMVGFYYITTTLAATTLSLINVSAAPITITPFAGSANVSTPSTAHLIITRVR